MATTTLQRFLATPLVAIALLATRPAHACEATEIPLDAAFIAVRRPPEGLTWDARYILDVDTSFDFHGGTIHFAVPLLPGEELRASTGIEALHEGGRIVGLCVSREGLHDRSVLASFVEALPSDQSQTTLGVPIARGKTVHILDAASSADARIEVSNGNFERNVGFVSPHGIGHGAREEARRLTGTPISRTRAVYVRGDDIQAAGELTGQVLDERARARNSALGVGLIFVSVVAALALAGQKLRQKASVERADAILASDIDAAVRAARS